MAARAWPRLENSVSFRPPSRKRPLKLSTKPFCMGLPGAMSCHSTPLCWHHLRTATEVSSVPLSETMVAGLFACQPKARERGVGHQRQALPAEVVDNGQHPETPTVREGIRSCIAVGWSVWSRICWTLS